MKVVLVENSDSRRLVNKDQMGGYGIGLEYGRSAGTRLLGWAKRHARIPLLTLGYLAAIFRKNGHDVAVYNEGDGPLPEADLILIASSIVESGYEVEFAARARTLTRARIGVVGPFASFSPAVYLPSADFVVRGEPERWAASIIGTDFPAGVVESPMVTDLNSLPFPDWSVFDIGKYGYWPILLDKPFVPVLSSRGCSFRCNYCPYIAQYQAWRMRRPENVVAEIRHNVERYGIRSFLFRDPLFTQGKGRAEALAQGLIREGLHEQVKWSCETRTDLLTEPLIDLLVQAGLRGLNVGVESADLGVLKSANRRQSQPHSERMIRYAESVGVKVACFYVLGLPTDTRETIEETIRYARRLNTFAAQFHVNTPFPGTPIYDMYRDAIFDHDWTHFTSFRLVFRHENLTADEIETLKLAAYDGYYYRAGYAAKHWRHLLPLALPAWTRTALQSGRRRRPAAQSTETSLERVLSDTPARTTETEVSRGATYPSP